MSFLLFKTRFRHLTKNCLTPFMRLASSDSAIGRQDIVIDLGLDIDDFRFLEIVVVGDSEAVLLLDGTKRFLTKYFKETVNTNTIFN